MPKALEELQLELKDSIETLECLEVLMVSSRDGDIRLLCRCIDQERWNEAMFLFLMKEYVWYSFIGKKYFAKEGRLRFAWVLMFSADDLEALVADVRSILSDILYRLDYKDKNGELPKDPEPKVLDDRLPEFAPAVSKKLMRRVKPLKGVVDARSQRP